MNGSVTVIQFLDQLFVRDMTRALEVGLHYYVFPLLCQAIEVLGALYDKESFNKYSESKKRFKRALQLLFDDERYAQSDEALFRECRGTLIHQLRPGVGFALTSSVYNGVSTDRHFAESKAGKVLIIEVFFDDFKKALSKLKEEIGLPGSRIDEAKLAQTFFSYGPVPLVAFFPYRDNVTDSGSS